MERCFLCKSKQKDDIQYGEFLRNKHYGVHTFCLYLSSNLSQNGKDDEGFLGFLDADIKKEEKRISFLKCSYCREKYANIGCCEKKCRNTFHLVCGVKNYCENRFCNDFQSYCHRHVRKIQQRPSATETCLICYDNLCTPQKKFKSVNMILTPCCRNGWFHKLCLQKFAKTAGYFFKCPLCNDADIFRKKLPARGIFIPNQDAAWELEPNAFAELLERPSVCSALECKNRRGPATESDHNPFVMCRACGSKAMHKLCLAPGLKSFYCNDCTIALEEGDSGRESFNSQNNNNADEDDDVDVCHVSDKEDLEIIKHLTGSDHDQQDSDSLSDNPIKPSSSRKQRILSSDLEHSDREQIQKNEIIKPCNSKHEPKLESVERRDDIKAESQLKKITHGNLTHNSDTESSEDFFIVKANRKRKSFIIASDSENEKQHSTAKQVCFDRKNTAELEDSDEDDDDDDPLENFYAILQKQKNITCAARRTHEKSEFQENPKGSFTVTDNENKDKRKKYSLPTKNHKGKTLDVSCIAKRTRRRKTMHSTESQRNNLQNCKESTKNHLDISCIAVRTRRRTVDAQNAQEYFQQRPYEMSQIYEKVHESENESQTTTTDDESLCDIATSDLQDFIVDDGYEEKDRNFEISCIANRTRKRKSTKALKIQTILEETENDDENDLSSSNSTSSTSKETAVALNKFRTHRKRCKQRILSTSSEESYTTSPPLTKFMAKMRARNLNNFLMPQYGSLNNQDHSNHTRKRL
ncbi:hypothetical protein DOY81_007007 [Sarcophaga bullata]|nr:hypothetical protein DOY81_007007 [Sarcophaga bullata]